MDGLDSGHDKHSSGHEHKCDCIHLNCPECGCMTKTKFVYIYRTVHMIENRSSVSVGDKVFWSNKVVARKTTECRL